ncbi:MAG: hypothetical protein AB1410_00150 [Acidobacteriota bacterium]
MTDNKGNPVTDLTQSDFDLHDNGKPKAIAYFEKHILSLPEKKSSSNSNFKNKIMLDTKIKNI